MLACVQDESSETTAKTADEANTQSTKICVDYEPCKKTEGCSRLCPIGQKHRGMCVVGGKALKPDKMQTDTDDEPKAGALGADRVLREKKHPMKKWLEDAESRLSIQQACPDMAAMAARYETPQPKEKKRKAADTDTAAKKQVASLKKENAALKKKVAAYEKKEQA